jgi:hypothetical protein
MSRRPCWHCFCRSQAVRCPRGSRVPSRCGSDRRCARRVRWHGNTRRTDDREDRSSCPTVDRQRAQAHVRADRALRATVPARSQAGSRARRAASSLDGACARDTASGGCRSDPLPWRDGDLLPLPVSDGAALRRRLRRLRGSAAQGSPHARPALRPWSSMRTDLPHAAPLLRCEPHRRHRDNSRAGAPVDLRRRREPRAPASRRVGRPGGPDPQVRRFRHSTARLRRPGSFVRRW